MERKIENLRNLAFTILVISSISLGFLGSICVDLRHQVEDLNNQMQATQDQLLTLSKDQLWITETVANWLESWQVDMFESTAYSPLDDKNGLNSWGDGQYMASGVKTVDHIDTAIAVDPKIIPLGSRVFIQGLGWRVAQDTGGLIKGKKIDVPVWTFEEAMKHGRENVLVMWPKEGDV